MNFQSLSGLQMYKAELDALVSRVPPGLVCMLEFEKVLNLQYQIYVDFVKFGLNSQLAY